MNLQFSLAQKLIDCLANNHKNNFDASRYGDEKQARSNLLPTKLDLLNSRGYFHKEQIRSTFTNVNGQFEEYWQDLEKTFNLLDDQVSKNIYIELLAYRILGYKKVKLSTNNSDRKRYLSSINRQIDFDKSIHSNFSGTKLYLHKFFYKNVPIKLYLSKFGSLNAFFLGQYRFSDARSAKEAEYIIDCGACWGDSTIEFATSIKNEGKVFAYEFIPKNKEILQKNINLNPSLSNRIELVDHAVWSKSNLDVYYKDCGPGSRVQLDVFSEHDGKTSTLTIDDLVELKCLPKVDLIKMDIEGAEPYALEGAVKTIKKYRPNLAISIYHNMDDFSKITPWLDNLGVGYKFYVRHFTIHSEETIMFAVKN